MLILHRVYVTKHIRQIASIFGLLNVFTRPLGRSRLPSVDTTRLQ